MMYTQGNRKDSILREYLMVHGLRKSIAVQIYALKGMFENSVF